MFCVNCGMKLADGTVFCPQCGTRVSSGGQGTDGNSDRNSDMNSGRPGTHLVAAKCTNCGGALTVDPGLQAAICPFCNTPYIVEKAIQNFKVTNNYIGTQINIEGVNAENLISLAESSLKGGNYSEAMSYADRALEQNPSDIGAWIIKIQAAGYDIDGDRTSEIRTYIDAALDHSTDENEEVRVYLAVFDVAIIHLKEADKLIRSNQDQIQRMARERRDRNDIAAMDSGYIIRTSKVINEAMEYRNIIPDAVCARSGVLQKKAVEMAGAYDRYCNSLIERYRVYGSAPSAKAQVRRQENLNRILGRGNGNQAGSGYGQGRNDYNQGSAGYGQGGSGYGQGNAGYGHGNTSKSESLQERAGGLFKKLFG